MTALRRTPLLVAATLMSALVFSLSLSACGKGAPGHSAHKAALQRAAVSSIEHMAYLEGPPATPLSNIQCVAPSDSALACVGFRNGGSIQTSYTVRVDSTTGKYIITSSASKLVESGSEASHPPPGEAGRRPTIFLDGARASGIGPHYKTKSSSITLTGSVAPKDASLTISGVKATRATAEYGYHPMKVVNGSFRLSLPVGPGENDFEILRGSEVIVTFAVTRIA